MQTVGAGTAARWPKYAFFAAVAGMGVFVLWNNERFLLDAAAPEWKRYAAVRWQLPPHGLAGAIALTFGALQFSTRLRGRRPALHRLIGKLYITAVCVAVPMAIWVAFLKSPWFLTAFTIIQAGTWLLFTGMAYALIRRREIASHREWMIRSYAIPLNFLEGRVLMAFPQVGSDGLNSVVFVNWACLVVTLIVTELVVQWPRLTRALASPAKPLTAA